MTDYSVNATMTVPAWIRVEADSPEAALEAAREYGVDAFEIDRSAAEIEFNVTPAVDPS